MLDEKYRAMWNGTKTIQWKNKNLGGGGGGPKIVEKKTFHCNLSTSVTTKGMVFL